MPRSRPALGPWAVPTEELIGVVVAPGVWVTALPFPSPLRYSLSYLVDTPGGTILVDPGWDCDDGWDRLQAGFANADQKVDELKGVVVTHAHADHYGSAARIRDRSGAWVAMHPAEQPQIAVGEAAAHRRLEEMIDWMRMCGAPAETRAAVQADADEVTLRFPSTWPDLDLAGSAPVPDTRGALTVVHTPGHTPGSVCFLDRERRVLFTGDHLLPRVTPNVSKRPASDPDPLLDFLASIDVVTALDANDTLTALPGHEWAFAAPAERVAELRLHHAARLAEVRAAVRGGQRSVWEVASVVRWSRPFGQLMPLALRSALGETYSHLFRLETAGAIRSVAVTPGDPYRWESIS